MLERQNKITLSRKTSRSIRIVRTEEETCSYCAGTGWTNNVLIRSAVNVPIQSKIQVHEFKILGEFLNDETHFVGEWRGPFFPDKLYLVRQSILGTEVIGEVEKDGN